MKEFKHWPVMYICCWVQFTNIYYLFFSLSVICDIGKWTSIKKSAIVTKCTLYTELHKKLTIFLSHDLFRKNSVFMLLYILASTSNGHKSVIKAYKISSFIPSWYKRWYKLSKCSCDCIVMKKWGPCILKEHIF